MTQAFNGLSAAEAERLALFIEECGEAIQAATKILRHGYNSYNPTIPNSPSNRGDLETEIAAEKIRELVELSARLRRLELRLAQKDAPYLGQYFASDTLLKAAEAIDMQTAQSEAAKGGEGK